MGAEHQGAPGVVDDRLRHGQGHAFVEHRLPGGGAVLPLLSVGGGGQGHDGIRQRRGADDEMGRGLLRHRGPEQLPVGHPMPAGIGGQQHLSLGIAEQTVGKVQRALVIDANADLALAAAVDSHADEDTGGCRERRLDTSKNFLSIGHTAMSILVLHDRQITLGVARPV